MFSVIMKHINIEQLSIQISNFFMLKIEISNCLKVLLFEKSVYSSDKVTLTTDTRIN